MTKTAEVGRLAMRLEGNMWTAYYALPHTMDGALLLGSIALSFVADPVRKEAFMGFMRECVSDLIEEKTGQRPEWPDGPHGAPEHERSGRA